MRSDQSPGRQKSIHYLIIEHCYMTGAALCQMEEIVTPIYKEMEAMEENTGDMKVGYTGFDLWRVRVPKDREQYMEE